MTGSLTGAGRREFAMGWPMVLAAAFGVALGTMGMGFYSLGLFVKPLQAEFGWSRAAVSGAATFQQLGIFLSAPVVGLLADRIGVRPIALASYIAMPLALVALSHTGNSVVEWYALWLLVSLAGCGTAPTIWARAVSARFDAARGLALGLMLMGTGSAAVLAPALLGPVIAAHGWRTAAQIMAGVALVGGIAVSLMTPRELRAADRAARVSGRFERNRATWLLLAVGAALGLIVAGLIIHLVPMLVDRGMAPVQAASMAASLGVAVIVARVAVGWLFDRFHAPYVAALFLSLPVLSCVLLWAHGPVLPAALMLGLAAGAEVDMLAFFTGRYARIENYGATYGWILGVFAAGAALGPLLVGYTVDATGNYDLALIASAVGLLAVVAVVACLGPYHRAADPA
ncbi:MFS transporter [Novosphingobium sp. FSY-8]|uniref:MFS transporter n=1 Tax=Novosphingobium ovatum TaxID=1908523 RepID=A0ABW9XEX3_9SPHN|nr:MFS transporter [Novosphingobium ovatum]NBC37093.1 MFS transporter [Novosphingobium ovatum]